LTTSINIQQIPGISKLTAQEKIPTGLFLLEGPAGAGKTMYCRQFLAEGLIKGDECIFISSSLTKKEVEELFASMDTRMTRKIKFSNPCQASSSKRHVAAKMSTTVKDILQAVSRSKRSPVRGKSTRIVVDSLTHILLICGEKVLMKFIMDLSRIMKDSPTTAICTLAKADEHLHGALSTFARGILEMKLDEDSSGSLNRKIRLLSIKGVSHTPQWINFKISDNGGLSFGEEPLVAQTCTLCGKPIIGTPFVESDFVFDTKMCIETYRKLAGAYGSSISETGLPSEAFNVSFFFIDIVGLSDPSLSVKKQIQKIETLNKFISSCEAFRKVSKDKRIILPTGDGMAIGFLQSSVTPLELSMELHGKLRAYNRGKVEEDQIGVRIGLGSGLVFTVTDMNNVQNVWGPGIILARRVMDAGDNGHILLADKLAEELIALKDEYRSIIKPICEIYEIKHGQKIALYSAYSQNFGNPELPAKVSRIK
jgi:KaiC/GvpD/RAD55 family RecA-like ATPase